MLKLGFFGFGCVGQGLYDIMGQTANFPAQVVKIAIKDIAKPRSLPMSRFTTNPDDILEDPSINVVVEMTNSPEEAFFIVRKAMLKGKHVVTANKKMLADHLPELVELQHKTGTSLLYEAAVCGSIPIIRNLAEYYDNELLHSVSGIFNGTSNYILSKIFSEGLDYDTALRQAQDLGFAETDPTSDVGGFDALYKLCLIAAQSYGLFIKHEEVLNIGIEHLNDFDIRYAKEKSYKLKLVAQAVKTGDKQLLLAVMPQFIPKGNYLHKVDMEYNAVVVEAAFSDRQVFVGKGAGGHPTGSAMISDISALRYNYRYEYRKVSPNNLLKYHTDVTAQVYCRTKNQAEAAYLPFQHIAVKYSEDGFHYIIGTMSFTEILQHKRYLQQNGIFLALMPQQEFAKVLRLPTKRYAVTV